MRVLVTGAGGFVGPWLARALAARGHAVHGLVRPGDAAPAGVVAHEADVTDAAAVARVLAVAGPDAVVHLAAVSFVPEADADPAAAWRINLGGALALLAALRDGAPRARLLHVGSADAYGAVRPDELPVAEEAPFRPLTVYGLTKAAADLAAGQWGVAHRLDVVRARPFNHTGPGQSARFVCPAFARQIARIERGEQEPVLRVGNLDPVRDFSDVRDVVAGYVALLERGRTGAVYNLCSGEGVRIRDVVERLCAQARMPIRIERDPALVRRADIERVIGSHARATADTAWRPTIPLDDTLRDVLEDWRTRRD